MDDKYSNLFDIVYKQNQIMKRQIDDVKEIYSTDDQRNKYIADMNESTYFYTHFLFYFYFFVLFVALAVAMIRNKPVVRLLMYGIFFGALPYTMLLFEEVVAIPFFSTYYVYT